MWGYPSRQSTACSASLSFSRPYDPARCPLAEHGLACCCRQLDFCRLYGRWISFSILTPAPADRRWHAREPDCRNAFSCDVDHRRRLLTRVACNDTRRVAARQTGTLVAAGNHHGRRFALYSVTKFWDASAICVTIAFLENCLLTILSTGWACRDSRNSRDDARRLGGSRPIPLKSLAGCPARRLWRRVAIFHCLSEGS